ncbi:uncharacterized protein zgc:193505 [Neoarius graeffei]|uniref:uncharacterized protein zgc:193505 n=1 Tax=Neoarius graeffei TaxID=443677 RepID=UPI00298BD14E|nr:uncharacterized protein zgc:193505 [Neoarius graeffei]
MSKSFFVDAVVDKAATAAKTKLKSMLGGGEDNKNKPSGSGGIGGLFPSAGDSNKKEKKGLFGGLFSTPENEMNPGEAEVGGGAEGGGESQDFNSAVDALAGL